MVPNRANDKLYDAARWVGGRVRVGLTVGMFATLVIAGFAAESAVQQVITEGTPPGVAPTTSEVIPVSDAGERPSPRVPDASAPAQVEAVSGIAARLARRLVEASGTQIDSLRDLVARLGAEPGTSVTKHEAPDPNAHAGG